jgi:hypothetical protein
VAFVGNLVGLNSVALNLCRLIDVFHLINEPKAVFIIFMTVILTEI